MTDVPKVEALPEMWLDHALTATPQDQMVVRKHARELCESLAAHRVVVDAVMKEATAARRADAAQGAVAEVPWWVIRATESALAMLNDRGYAHTDLAAARDWLREAKHVKQDTRPAAPGDGEWAECVVNGYLPRSLAVELKFDSTIPAWMTERPRVRVKVAPASPQPGGEAQSA